MSTRHDNGLQQTTLMRFSQRTMPTNKSKSFRVQALSSLLMLSMLCWFGYSITRNGSAVNSRMSASSTDCENVLTQHHNARCEFVRQNCQDEESGIVPYLTIYYCNLSQSEGLAWLLIIIWLCGLILAIGICAGDFFSTNLSFMAKKMHLSNSLAGVTLLAVGNGAPDIFSTWAAVNSNNVDLAVGEVIGAASFITTVIAGTLGFLGIFHVRSGSLVRDAGFLLFTAIVLLMPLMSGRLFLWHGILMVTTYTMYVGCVLVQHWMRNKRERATEAHDQQADTRDNAGEAEPLLRSSNAGIKAPDSCSPVDSHTLDHRDLDTWRRMHHSCVTSKNETFVALPSLASVWNYHEAHRRRQKARSTAAAPAAPEAMHENPDALPSTCSTSNSATNIVGVLMPSWHALSIRAPLHAIVSSISAIPHLIFKLTTPSVNEERPEGCECSQNDWLLMIQCVTAPQVVWVTQWLSSDHALTLESWWRPAVCCLAGSLVICLVIAFFDIPASSSSRLVVTSLAGLVLSAYWLSLIADEAVAIMKTIGIILQISQAMLGFSLFAVGNSMDDFFADIMIAKHGHAAMSFAACFGGPLLNILLGLGTSVTYRIVLNTSTGKQNSLQIGQLPTLILSTSVLAVTMALLVVVLYFRRWEIGRFVGSGLILIWILSTIANIILESRQ